MSPPSRELLVNLLKNETTQETYSVDLNFKRLAPSVYYYYYIFFCLSSSSSFISVIFLFNIIIISLSYLQNALEVYDSHIIPLTESEENQLIKILTEQVNASLVLEHAYPRVLRLTASTTPLLIDVQQTEWKNLTLYYRCIDRLNCFWETSDDVSIIVISDKAMQGVIGDLLISINGLGVITFYAVIVVAIGQVVRSIFSSRPWQVLYEEIIDSEDLLYLCDAVYIARYLHYKGHLKDEYQLSLYVLQIYRHPDILTQITKKKYD